MLFFQPTVRRTREEGLKQGKPQGCQQSQHDHSLEPPGVNIA